MAAEAPGVPTHAPPGVPADDTAWATQVEAAWAEGASGWDRLAAAWGVPEYLPATPVPARPRAWPALYSASLDSPGHALPAARASLRASPVVMRRDADGASWNRSSA